ncbi:MAG: Gfo/Idh/MocA family oxidoreductase [Hyphomicrobiales bacterium]|nr:Gfo/Idh/MocA family oxidoreductase [Hyphomicrobiales bacterium]MDE2115848.1 Gfo/Idh/MocA family oxidoreductase [Hyphomicrobiales bacterium]
MSIRIGLIGAGIMGADHARILSLEIPGVTLQQICDADAARARSVAETSGARDVGTNPLALIADKSIDAVLIASPDHTHADLTKACIAQGKPVLCEKPLSPDSTECLDVIAAEVKSGRRLVQIGFMRRFDPAYVEMKQTLAKGAIGPALMMHNFHRNVSAPASFTGQMSITNSAPHEFDIARFMLDADYESISVFCPEFRDSGKTGAPVFMVLKTRTGQLVNVEINNNAAYGYDVRGELVGEKGSVFLRSPINSELHVNLQTITTYPADWRPRFAEAYRLQNCAWVKSIETGHPAGASAWDGYAASLVAEAGIASLALGGEVKISSAAKPSLY